MILPVLTLQNVLDFYKFENALFKPSLQKNCAANDKICKWMMSKLKISHFQKWLEVSSKKNSEPPGCELCQYQYIRHKKFVVRNTFKYQYIQIPTHSNLIYLQPKWKFHENRNTEYNTSNYKTNRCECKALKNVLHLL